MGSLLFLGALFISEKQIQKGKIPFKRDK